MRSEFPGDEPKKTRPLPIPKMRALRTKPLPPAPAQESVPHSAPPESGKRAKAKSMDDEPFIGSSAEEPHERLRFEFDDEPATPVKTEEAPEDEEKEMMVQDDELFEETDEERLQQAIETDPDAIRWAARLAATPNDVEHATIRAAIEGKIAKARLLAEERVLKSKKDAAHADVEQAQKDMKAHEKKLVEQHQAILKAKEKEQELREELSALEVRRTKKTAKAGEVTEVRAGFEEKRLLQQTEAKNRVKGWKRQLKALELTLKRSDLSDIDRSNAEAQREGALKSITDTEAFARQLEGSTGLKEWNESEKGKGEFTAQSERAHADVIRVERALSAQIETIEELERDLGSMESDRSRLSDVLKQATEREEAATIPLKEVEIRLGGFSGVTMGEDLPVATEAPAAETAAVAGLSAAALAAGMDAMNRRRRESRRAMRGAAFKETGRLAKKGGKKAAGFTGKWAAVGAIGALGAGAGWLKGIWSGLKMTMKGESTWGMAMKLLRGEKKKE